ncbi:MAG TPA: efflux RND transporter permease subunit [Verrucomicrobiae bacterium]|nr:efflux RND transporter permease subunit [Verrucomicrobiae bacterium]
MPRFFIDRPIFAWVISILILVAGALSLTQLPIAQYPSIAPPSVAITATYPGASAETLQNTVTAVIEQQLNGIDRLLYMSSVSQSSGQAVITLYFEPGTNPDIAQVQVQNKLQLAMPQLPAAVQQQGVIVAKATRNFLMFFTLSSTNLDETALGNFIASKVLDPIRRINGVGEADEFGSEYAMRVWLDPAKMDSFNLTASDVVNAIQAQNVQVAAGQLGARPALKGQQLNVVLQGQSTLTSPEEFGKIILRVNPDGSRVYLRDVAKIAFGGQNYTTQVRVNGVPAAAVGVKLSPTANALATADAVRAKVADLSKFFPAGIKVNFPYDSSAFVRISIKEVVFTLLEAIGLVFLVIYLFLQNIRATFIPTIVVPVALMGTFTIMRLTGFSINVLTMFGMVLAIGLLVDDAIVVVENVERIMSEEGLSPRDATRKSMGQITGALIGIALVLTAVFIPMAFFGGSVGAIYRQFSLAMVASMLFSIFLAMSFTPSLCATLLKPVEKGHHHEKKGLFGWFNRGYNAGARKYQGWVERILGTTGRYLAIYLAIIVAMGFLYVKLPSSFLPEEDQGYFINAILLPVGATQERTVEALKQVESYYLKQPEVADVIAVAGFSFNGQGQNAAVSFVRFKDWSERHGKEHHVQGVIGRAFMALSAIKDAVIYPINPPPIPELGTAAGFDFELEDQGGLGHEKLMAARNQLLGMAAQNPNVAGVRPQGMEDTAEMKIDIDWDKASALGVAPADINNTLTTYFGSTYVNNFVDGNRVQQVIVQSDSPHRMLPQDIGKLFVRNSTGTMVPFSTFTTLRWIYGSPQLERYNGFPSREIIGTAGPGKSSGDAMKAMEEMAAKLPAGVGYEWTGQSYEERLSGSQAPALYTISLLVVFLCLAALYESWAIPFSVILAVPLGVLGALLAAHLRGLPNDVFFKVGLITTIGLATKNAILIVEFAKNLQTQGKSLIEATLEAVHIRLRPILMTSFAFILGVLPLAVSSGAGSASQNAIGTGVIGGMAAAVLLGIFFVPVFFVVIRRIFGAKPSHHDLAVQAGATKNPDGKNPDAQ